MKHAEELNRIIAFAAKRPDFTNQSYTDFENESREHLASVLQQANLFFTCSVLGMEAVSHVIEDQAVNLGGDFRFFSAFQKISRLKPQEERYRALLELSKPVYVFAIPDVKLWWQDPNLHLVRLEKPDNLAEDNLAHNWFVVLDNPKFVSMALVARELPTNARPMSAPDRLVYRNFEGFWTYDRTVIKEVVAILDDYIAQQHSEVSTN